MSMLACRSVITTSFCLLICLLLPPVVSAQQDTSLSAFRKLFREYYDENTIDINKVPINICFITKNDRYAGFVIAGHADKKVCEVASLQVKNFLDSVGYQDNTIFSYGVGFDLCGNRDSILYDRKLREMERIFITLQEDYFYYVSISHVTDSLFRAVPERIKTNTNLAASAMKNKNSLNRVIFKYSEVNFPLPVPFYRGDSIVTIVIPKKNIGTVPSVKAFDPAIIDVAITDLKKMRQLNNTALSRLGDYNPDNYLRFVSGPYLITYFNGEEVVKPVDFRLAGVTREEVTSYGSRTIRYWSLNELATKCSNKEGKTIKVEGQVKGRSEWIDPCEALRLINSEIKSRAADRDMLIVQLRKVNRSLDNQLNRIASLKEKISKVSTANDNLILIDALLRGWCFKPSSQATAALLTNWYKKREVIWKNILSSDQNFSKRIAHKSKGRYNSNAIIAGVFQSEDVFFAVNEKGGDYIVTPYKMLSGNFFQVVDRDNSIVQFVSENNFRVIKL